MQVAKARFFCQREAVTPPLQHELIIEPGQGMAHYWQDLWRYRELFFFLAWRDIAVRYKQTVIGVAWALIRPFLTMIVLLWRGTACCAPPKRHNAKPNA